MDEAYVAVTVLLHDLTNSLEGLHSSLHLLLTPARSVDLLARISQSGRQLLLGGGMLGAESLDL